MSVLVQSLLLRKAGRLTGNTLWFAYFLTLRNGMTLVCLSKHLFPKMFLYTDLLLLQWFLEIYISHSQGNVATELKCDSIYLGTTLLQISHRMCCWKNENRLVFNGHMDKSLRLTFWATLYIYHLLLQA